MFRGLGFRGVTVTTIASIVFPFLGEPFLRIMRSYILMTMGFGCGREGMAGLQG